MDLFEGVCVESQVSCTLQVFFCHCHLFCCCLLFCCYWFVIILMAWLYVSACHHKLCLYLLDWNILSFFLLPLPSFCSLHNSYKANVVCQNQDPQPDFHVTGTCLSRFRMQEGMMELDPDPDSGAIPSEAFRSEARASAVHTSFRKWICFIS